MGTVLVQRALHTHESQPRNTKATEADQNVDQAVQTGPRKTRNTLHQGDFCARFLVLQIYFFLILPSSAAKGEKNPFELSRVQKSGVKSTKAYEKGCTKIDFGWFRTIQTVARCQNLS